MVRLIHSGGRQPEHLLSLRPHLVSLGMWVQEVDDLHPLLAYAGHAEHQQGVMAVLLPEQTCHCTTCPSHIQRKGTLQQGLQL